MQAVKRPYGVTAELIDNRRFHRSEKEASMTTEISLSHQLRFRNSFVQNGWTYGEALGHFVLDRGYIPTNSPKLVEVGGGLGDVAHDFISVLLEAKKDVSYTIVDLSPKLQQAQRRRLAEFGDRVCFINGDAERLARLVQPADFVLCNEAVGDFRTIKGIPADIKIMGEDREPDPFTKRLLGVALGLIRKYDLEVPDAEYLRHHSGEKTFALNYGAIKFVESLGEVLKPGGCAFVVEHADELSGPIRLLGHTEYTMSTRHMEQVLKKLGFTWSRGDANDFLKIDCESRGRLVSFQHVAYWLAMGADPMPLLRHADVSETHGQHCEELSPYAQKIKANPETYFVLDWAVTPGEFEQLKEERGWNIDGKPCTESIGPSAFAYYAIRKPTKVDVEPKAFPKI